MLKINTGLNYIDLSSNQISKIGDEHIINALKINQTITTIYLRSYHRPVINQICGRNEHNGYQKNVTLRSLCYAEELA